MILSPLRYAIMAVVQ